MSLDQYPAVVLYFTLLFLLFTAKMLNLSTVNHIGYYHVRTWELN